jgi:AraC-like DNA-binding protein
MSNDKEIINRIRQDLAIELPENILLNDAVIILASYINDLIQKDFNKLISILYRLDVSENKLRRLLEENTGSDAGRIIADLVIERQLQKIKSRRQFHQPDNDIDENEKW